MTLSTTRNALRNIHWAAGFRARLGVNFAADRLISVCGNERGFMYAFLLLDNLNLTFSELLVLRCRLLRILYTAICCLVRNDTALTSPRKILSAQPPVSDGLSPSSNCRWPIIYLDRDVYAPNAVLSSHVRSSLLCIFDSVRFLPAYAVRFSRRSSEPWMCNSSGTLRSLQFITCGAASSEVLFSHLDTLSSGWLLNVFRFKVLAIKTDFVYNPFTSIFVADLSHTATGVRACLDNLFAQRQI